MGGEMGVGVLRARTGKFDVFKLVCEEDSISFFFYERKYCLGFIWVYGNERNSVSWLKEVEYLLIRICGVLPASNNL